VILVRNFDSLEFRDDREVIRCRACRLVQFRPLSETCRRCHIALECWQSEAPPISETKNVAAKLRRRPEPDFGLAIRYWREVYQLTTAELARRMGFGPHNVWKLETHRVGTPTLATCQRYAEVFGISLRQLVMTAEELGKGS
jgi:DNA-binding XRE family transcriptional regulator